MKEQIMNPTIAASATANAIVGPIIGTKPPEASRIREEKIMYTIPDIKSRHGRIPATVCGIIDLGIQDDNENHVLLMLELAVISQRDGCQLQEYQAHQNEIICIQMKNEDGLSLTNKDILTEGFSLDGIHAPQLSNLEMLVGRTCHVKTDNADGSILAYYLADANKSKFAITMHKAQAQDGKIHFIRTIADSFVFDMKKQETWDAYYRLPAHIQSMIGHGARRLIKMEPGLKGIVPEVTRKNRIRRSSKISIFHVIPCIVIVGFVIMLAAQVNVAATVFIIMFIVLVILNQREGNRQRYAGVKWK